MRTTLVASLALAGVAAGCSSEGGGHTVAAVDAAANASPLRKARGEVADAGAVARTDISPPDATPGPDALAELAPEVTCLHGSKHYVVGGGFPEGCVWWTCGADGTWRPSDGCAADASVAADARAADATPADVGVADASPPLPDGCPSRSVLSSSFCAGMWPGTTHACAMGCHDSERRNPFPPGDTLWSCFTWTSQVVTNNGQIVCVGGGIVGCNYYCPVPPKVPRDAGPPPTCEVKKFAANSGTECRSNGKLLSWPGTDYECRYDCVAEYTQPSLPDAGATWACLGSEYLGPGPIVDPQVVCVGGGYAGCAQCESLE